MENLEEKLGIILNDPKMMQQIMTLAQSLGNSSQEHTSDPGASAPIKSNADPAVLQKVSALAGKTGIDQNQKQLLQALRPYLASDRVSKLENAMRAAKLARMASAFLSNGGIQMLSGR